MEIFKKIFPKAVGSKGECQMQTLHAIQPKRQGITMINMGVGPANAKTLTDQIAVLRPSCMIMIGHCGGLKNTQNIGDFLLADKYFRDDHVMGSVLDARVPISSTLILNTVLLSEIQRKKMPFRIGTVFTTNNRDWEYKISYYKKKFGECRAYGIDMESSVVCAQGFRYKIPHATLLMISDKPLHGKPKMAKASQEFYEETKKTHVRIAINAVNSLDKVERTHMTLSGLGFYPGSHMDALMW
jgi:AMP nucleosidase